MRHAISTMGVEADVGLAGILPLADIIPFPDLVFGGAILVVGAANRVRHPPPDAHDDAVGH